MKPINYRKIIEQHLGRKLNRNEIIHHKDGNQRNNKLSNLKILNTQSEHREFDSQIKINWTKKLNRLCYDLYKTDINQMLDSLDIFFTKRQQYIIFRKYFFNDLTKTEREYYSRCIKKKLKAIAYPVLHKIANQLNWELM